MINKTKENSLKRNFKEFYFLAFFILINTFSFGQNAFEMQKLEDFAKMYGVIRYFHPSDEASLIDWKAFAVYGINEIGKVKTKQEFRKKT